MIPFAEQVYLYPPTDGFPSALHAFPCTFFRCKPDVASFCLNPSYVLKAKPGSLLLKVAFRLSGRGCYWAEIWHLKPGARFLLSSASLWDTLDTLLGHPSSWALSLVSSHIFLTSSSYDSLCSVWSWLDLPEPLYVLRCVFTYFPLHPSPVLWVTAVPLESEHAIPLHGVLSRVQGIKSKLLAMAPASLLKCSAPLPPHAQSFVPFHEYASFSPWPALHVCLPSKLSVFQEPAQIPPPLWSLLVFPGYNNAD